MTGLTAKIALSGTTVAFDKLYTYAVPNEFHALLKKGMRVLVPFGRGNLKKQGIVFEILADELKGLKSITKIIDEEPVLNEEMLALCSFMQNRVFCTYYDAVNAMLPTGISYSLVNNYCANEEFSPSLLEGVEREVYDYLYSHGEKSEKFLIKELGILQEVLNSLYDKQAIIKTSDAKRKMGDATQKWVKFATEEIPEKLTAKQSEVIRLLNDVGSCSVKEVCYFTGVTQAVVDNLVKKGVLCYFEKQVYRATYHNKNANPKEISLTDEQNDAFLGLLNDYKNPQGKVSLLYGVTGSGKTQVFLKLADKVISDNKGVIVMVPEIALTPQLIGIFTERYGDKIAVFHSGLSLGQRMDEWKRIKEGKALIAIGTRSAIFAPFSNLGLIIIDEEQEHTYKSEKTPRFHTRDLAKFRTVYNKGLLCLASATPSVETFTKAKNTSYGLYKLSHRFGNATLPETVTVDMKKEMLNGNTGSISNTLYEALNETLKNKKQAILLLNRRGHNTYISCPECGYVATCPNCSISMTYHSKNNRLMCHYCGYSEEKPSKCPECQGEHLKFSGLGTQKAQEEISALFKDAKILRLDADSTMTKDSYGNYLTAFSKGEYDILLGTQMVAKGLDFPNVTLVGVLGADAATYSEDFRSFERTFSLLTQVIGRAGRGDNEGLAIIQTQNPDSNVIALAKNQDYDSFYDEEISLRKLMVYPPFCDICVVSSQATSSDNASKAIFEVFENIKNLIKTKYKDVKLIILGPSAATVMKVNNRYRFRMIIKCKNNSSFREMLKSALDIKQISDTSVSVDINPETVI